MELQKETMQLTGTVEFSGILKLSFEKVQIPTADALYKDVLVKNQKQHITLCHQQVPKLLNKKEIKQHLKQNQYKLSVTLDLEKHSFITEDETQKEVVIYYPTEESSSMLRTWTDNFLQQFTEKNVNDLRDTTLDKGRVFHLSYMNKSGNPGDSIAIIW